MIDRSFVAITLAAALTVGTVTFVMAPRIDGLWREESAATGETAAAIATAGAGSAASVYYSGCNAVRDAGAAPLRRGQPGYRIDMDGDGDGIACEDHGGGGGGSGFGGFRGGSRRHRR